VIMFAMLEATVLGTYVFHKLFALRLNSCTLTATTIAYHNVLNDEMKYLWYLCGSSGSTRSIYQLIS
jgi:hypothetical protein